jgi:ribonuclease M5
MEKIRIREAILVEGRYDAHKLRQWIDGVVLEAGGFSLFSIPKKLKLIKDYAENQGLIILTDSDHAGLFIRNRLKGMLPSETVRHAYIPPTPGKEKRKPKPSAEGLLGVEGMPKEVVLAALRKAGATIEGETLQKQPSASLSGRIYMKQGFLEGLTAKQEKSGFCLLWRCPRGFPPMPCWMP